MADTAPTTGAPDGARDSGHETDQISNHACEAHASAGHLVALCEALSACLETVDLSTQRTLLHLMEGTARAIEGRAEAIQTICYRRAQA